MQPPPPVAAPMVVSTIQTPRRKEHYMSKCVLGLSVTQIIIGALCILFQVVLICRESPLDFVGQGIWSGLFFILTGSFGIVSSKWKTTCFIVTFLVLAILSAVITFGSLLTSSLEISFRHYYYYSDGYKERRVVVGIDTVLIILAVAQVVLAIISSALSCHGLCGGNQNQSGMVAGQVHYIPGPDGQQQMVIIPYNQQGAAAAAGPSFNPAQTQLPANNQTPPQMYESETKLPIPE